MIEATFEHQDTEVIRTVIAASASLLSDRWSFGNETMDCLSSAFSTLLGNPILVSPKKVTSTRTANDWWKFQTLLARWRVERGATSSITQMATCPAYQEIIGMGRDAVLPLILHQIESEGDDPDMWFWALKSLTGADPVLAEDRGDFRAMAQAWLRWGRVNCYVW